MSEQIIKILGLAALAGDGAVIGIAVAYFSVITLFKYSSTSSYLKKLHNVSSVTVSDLRSILSADDAAAGGSGTERLVIVRGMLEPRSAIWKSLGPSVLISSNESQSVPCILTEGGRWPQSSFVTVNFDGSKHPVPCATISPSPHNFLEAVSDHDSLVGLLDKVNNLLPVKEVTAVGICSLKDGAPEIKACQDLPLFISYLGKDQIVQELAFRSKVLLWSGVVLGSVAIGILGHAAVRNWNRWKERRLRQQIQQHLAASAAESQAVAEERGNIPDGELCVICTTRRRRSAFIPCGHLACCTHCAFIVVMQETYPECPVCRQTVHSNIRVYRHFFH